MGGLEGELGGIFSKKDGSVREEAAKHVLMGELIRFGVSKDAAETLLDNILPKIRQGKKLGASQVRLVNEALTKALIDAEVEDIRESERVERFEKTVTHTAEDILADENAAAGRYYNDRGELVDINGEPIAAANGYSGMVSEPTLFLAGEAGPRACRAASLARAVQISTSIFQSTQSTSRGCDRSSSKMQNPLSWEC